MEKAAGEMGFWLEALSSMEVHMAEGPTLGQGQP